MEFFEAIRSGNTAEVERHLKDFPDLIKTKDERGFPPIVLATYHEQPEVTKILLRKGAETDARDAAGNTALMGICFKGNTEIAEMLIKNGANVNAQNNSGGTALIFAATFGQEKIARLLLKHGAERSIQDEKGKSALDYAQDSEMADLLKHRIQ